MPKKPVAIFFLPRCWARRSLSISLFRGRRTRFQRATISVPFPRRRDQTTCRSLCPNPCRIPTRLKSRPARPCTSWLGPREQCAKALEAEAEGFQAATGHGVSLTIGNDAAAYRHDLQKAPRVRFAIRSLPDRRTRFFRHRPRLGHPADVTPNPAAPRAASPPSRSEAKSRPCPMNFPSKCFFTIRSFSTRRPSVIPAGIGPGTPSKR